MSGKVCGDDDERPKWSCDYCTYENWPSAIKCTMCCAARPRPYTRDIFEISAYEGRSSPPTEPPYLGTTCSSGTSAKWSCSTCTYLNWPRAVRCAQCRTPKSALRNNRNGRRSPSSSSSTITPIVACESPVAEDLSLLTDKLQTLSCASTVVAATSNTTCKKWICASCTYENFPKSLKCVICRTPRACDDFGGGDSSPSPTVSRSETPVGPDSTSNNPQGATADLDCDSIIDHPKRTKGGKRRLREVDWMWLNACQAVVDGIVEPVITYLKAGGDPARQLSRQDAFLLKQPPLFESGLTLVHLCLKFKRETILATVLETLEERRGRNGLKRMPSIIAPGLAKEIRKHVESSLRYKTGVFPGQFFSECPLFSLPAELIDLSPAVQGHLWEELLDHEAQRELEESEEHAPPAINWLPDIMMENRCYSRLYALWNRTAGDCLLDACMQAAWGICDREGTLRRTLAETLSEATSLFYPRWQEYECICAGRLGYALNQRQLRQEWGSALRCAGQPGAALSQIHVFILAHIFRRPIIVYGVKCIKSFRGEVLGHARFEGLYLPLLWDQSFCWKSPLTLGYTRGHFSALVPRVPVDYGAASSCSPVLPGHGCGGPPGCDDGISIGLDGPIRMRRPGGGGGGGRSATNFVPLVTGDGKMLPVHYVTHAELGHEDRMVRQWLDVCLLENGGPLVAEQHIPRPSLLVAQMLDEWLNYYRQLSEMYTAPFRAKCAPSEQGYVIDNGSDSE